MKLTTLLHLVRRLKNEWSYTSTPTIRLYGVVLSYTTERGQLYLYLYLTVAQAPKKFSVFIDVEGELSRSRKPTIGPHPEPDESFSHPHTVFKIRCMPRSPELVSSFKVFRPKFCTHLTLRKHVSFMGGLLAS
jgi:hypothetical protein